MVIIIRKIRKTNSLNKEKKRRKNHKRNLPGKTRPFNFSRFLARAERFVRHCAVDTKEKAKQHTHILAYNHVCV